ncbi:MAG: hypothetical protein CM1200mP39_14680 [Dehalococcoidia bacterium]|nr:MAG: hypothetical protein CM1200mP39_14680 [Dehalococcoidia bacterium]
MNTFFVTVQVGHDQTRRTKTADAGIHSQALALDACLLLLAAFFVFFMGTVAREILLIRLGNRHPRKGEGLRTTWIKRSVANPLHALIGNALKRGLGESYVFQGKQ